mmetsp:Transcript_16908/g.41720  ORF Transcript_16908/g.41720 Transcript_16908/m.41720 type:complete len:438 (-) Transcript_16908:45-1358(-)
MSSDEEARRKREKPHCTAAQVIAFVRTRWKLTSGDGVDIYGDIDDASATELNSYDDRNFRVRVTNGATHTQYTLKVHNGVESQMPQLLAAQSGIMRHLNSHGVPAPMPVRPTATTAAGTASTGQSDTVPVDANQSESVLPETIPASDGQSESTADASAVKLDAPAGDRDCDWEFLELPLTGGGGAETHRRHAVRVLTWVHGEIAEQSSRVVHTPAFMRSIGAFIGDVSTALESFHHVGAERWHLWDNANVLSVRQLAHAVDDLANRATVEQVLIDFETKVLPVAGGLRKGVLQNDANDQNIVVQVGDASGECIPVGLLDFGDMLVSWRVNDIAISLAYFMLGKEDPVGDAAMMLAGFESTFPLTANERRLLPTLIATRLVCSCVCGAYSAAADPANQTYLLLTQKPGWAALSAIRTAGDEACLRRFAEAAAVSHPQL